MKVLALDLATRSGWAIGKVGAKAPAEHGSYRFAGKGASRNAVFGNALTWFSVNLKAWSPDIITYESPLQNQWRGRRSREGNDEIAYGLPAILQAVAFLRGFHDVRSASAKDVRLHFIHANPKRDIAKKATMRRCRQLGWDVEDDNDADACAIWSYQCAFLDPKLAIRTSPLFTGLAPHADELS